MDSILDDSIFDAAEDSDDFAPEPVQKPKKATKATKAAPKKAAKTTTKKMTQTTLKSTKAKSASSKKRSKPETDDDNDDAAPEPNGDDESLLLDTPPSEKKRKKNPPAGRKGTGKALHPVENDAMGLDGADDSKSKANSSSDQYQKLTQLEHILKRPDTYVGSIEHDKRPMWVYNSETESMEMREVNFVPGLYKIFDEILVNAADNKQRDKNMDTIKVTIDRAKGEISVYNNGRGIPVEIHDKEQIYIPEMIFGHLLTSSNYDDEQQKVTGGRNGFGAKLCNIFSTEFTVETIDSRMKKKYRQTWTDNMSQMEKAKITVAKGDSYTKIIFTPDYKRFGMEGIDDDFEALVKRRVYDLAGTVKVSVHLNGAKITGVRNFKKYMEMYTKAIKMERGEEAVNDSTEIVTDNPDPRWEIGFAVSDGSFQQVSFVNSIATTSGGTHVNYISDQICTKLLSIVNKKNKGGAALKVPQIRNHIFLFINCMIVNPAFNSQTKEQLTTKSSQFGSKCVLSDQFLNKIAKTQVILNILDFAQRKADQILRKGDGHGRKRISNAKLVDANKAGTKDGHRCTLILTEGESAKGLAIAGRAVVDPDLFGVFPLRGKLLNVRDASVDQVAKNVEIQSIKNFFGLQHKKQYADTKGLRYGHLMIMTDQDHDGSHIKGLIINFLQVAFPSLLKIPEFLHEFITPIVKVYKGDPKKPKAMHSFFTIPEYESWIEEHGHEKGWEHKYYKGLGTSTTQDAQVYFRDLDKHLKVFHTMQDEEAPLIELAFSKYKADERKEWLRQFKPGTYLDHSVKEITYHDFVHKELILFSMADNMRSIPSVVDGFKPGQRKVMFTSFKRNLKKDIKVVELAGLVSGLTAYQHGDVSLQQTIVGLAQTFVGSNNINVLEPSGNFGSRLQGGSDCASARYIYTRLSPFARKIFHPADDPLLVYNVDDGKKIEPEMYIPVVPMALINGADGIGTGWSTSIPNYNPEDVVENLKLLMDGQDPKPMIPWFRGFKGDVTQVAPDRFKFSGIITQIKDTEVQITELPIRMWTQDFKSKLEEIIKAEKTPSFIKDYRDNNSHTDVDFVIQMEEKHMKIALEEGLEEKFKLYKSIATSNLVAFDPEGRIHKYASAEDILKEFFLVRIRYYEKRKQCQLSELQKQLDKFSNQARFVQMIIDGKLVVSKKKKSVLIVELQKLGFKALPKIEDAIKEGEIVPIADKDETEEEEDEKIGADAYDYLLGMPIWSLTKERVEKLLQQIGDRETEIDALIKLSKEDLWKRDLEEFLEVWRAELDEERAIRRKNLNMGRRASMKLKIAGKGVAARKRKNEDEDDDDFVVSKSKKATKSKASQSQEKSSLLSYLTKTSGPSKAKEKSSTPSIAQADGSKDSDDSAMAPVVSKRGRTAAKNKKVKDEDESDASIKPVKATNSRRAATRKPIKYEISSDDDDDIGDDLLGDVSKMVKGIGGSSGEVAPSAKTFFSASSATRPGSSGGLQIPASRPSKLSADISDDETDYAKLLQGSPRKSIAGGAGTINLSDNEYDSFNFGSTKPSSTDKKLEPKAAAKAVPKVTPKVAPKKRGPVKKPATSAAPAKKVPLSPAAKVYATKQAKGKQRKIIDSDDEEEADDLDALANDILDSDSPPEADEAESSPPPRAVASRRGLRGGAAKKKYVIEDEEDEDEEESEEADDFSDDFDDDD
ncbi:MAG: DNA topoisomerase 2 [Cirrosporium novae-zelandiae]|nr:MAG: DNA topoisomerase 2 [Cirrosporium novae-zelandiae]